MNEICTLSDYWRNPKADHIAELASVLEGCKSMIENMGGDPSRVTWAIDGMSRTYLDNAQVLLDIAPLSPTDGKVETPLETEAVDEVIGYAVHEAGHLLYSREHAAWENTGGRGRRGGKVTVKGGSKTLNSQASIDWPQTQAALAEAKNILEDYYIDNHVGIEWPVLGEYIARARKHYETTAPETNEIHNAVATYPHRISRQALQGLWINVALYRHLLPKGSNPVTVDAVKRLMDISKRALNTHDGATRAQMAVEAANVLYEFGVISQQPPTTPTPPQGPEGEPCDDGDPTDGDGEPSDGDGEAQDSGQGDNPNPKGRNGGSPAPDEPDSTGETGDGDAEGEGEGEDEGEGDGDANQESDNPSEPNAGDEPVGDEGETGDTGSADGENDAETEGESDEDGAPGNSDSPSGEEAGNDSDGSDGDGNGSEGSEEGSDSGQSGGNGSGTDDRNLEHQIQDILNQGENPNKANGNRGYTLSGFDNRARQGLTMDEVQEIEDAVTQNLEVLTDLLDVLPNQYTGQKPRVVALDAEYDGAIEARYKDLTRKETKEVKEIFRKQRDVADRWLFGQPKGRFDDKRLHKPFLGDPNFRKQRAVVSKPDMTVGLLLDVSGSMGRFMPLVYQTATIFSEGLLNESGINFSAWTYTSTGQGVALTRVADSALGKLHLNVVNQGGGTPSGEAIMGAAELMARSRTKHRLLIHFTDGSTSINDTQKAVAFAEKRGVSVFCIALDEQGLHAQYGEGNFTVINSVPELPQAVSDMLKQLAK